ncbi:hypothetical protein, conserved [Entamoeba dispar SAW760]|uniref:WWE domain-containing protein n=1 Tax=Entamoeba dispar (strain ATCC PRA-260 / SAW760) TaxID=370354 RepID=B0ECT1_ENTDS|nr:uncharacterized protein EDI_277940 [Entamoeba dispar SAW760]EDR27623.1 hypothetical protein, conserved [Entamoeba dispar SAW760]|eukprot:EDR27623.1 hypothetical protein, conserved [Entamoeba dispar SAW760]
MNSSSIIDEPTLIEKKDETTTLDQQKNDTTLVEDKDETVIIDMKKEMKRIRHEQRKRFRESGKRTQPMRACKGKPLIRFRESDYEIKKKPQSTNLTKEAEKVEIENQKRKSKKELSSSKQLKEKKKSIKTSSLKIEKQEIEEVKENKEIQEETNIENEEKKPKSNSDDKKLKNTKKLSKPSIGFKSYSSNSSSIKTNEDILEELPFHEANESHKSSQVHWWYYEDKWVQFRQKESIKIEEEFQKYLKDKKKKTYLLNIWKSTYSINFSKFIQINNNQKSEKFFIRRLLIE